MTFANNQWLRVSVFRLPMTRHRLIYLGKALGIAVVYILASRAGIDYFPMVEENISLIWPPAGIALAAFLLFGETYWPAIVFGEFVVNYTAEEPTAFLPVCGLAVANTVAPLWACYMLRRYIGFQNTLDKLKHVFGFIGIAVLLSPLIGATIGTLSLCYWDELPWSSFKLSWWSYWLGDTIGILVITPVCLTLTITHKFWRMENEPSFSNIG